MTVDTLSFFITPADICLVRPLTIRLLAAAYEKNPGKIIHPGFYSKRGHTPLIPTSLVSVILRTRTDGGLKAVLKKFEHLAVNVPVPDRHILMDMNLPEDYGKMLLRYPNQIFPVLGRVK
jgi:CTP:molybdopterin cytidylyltransferase MocA